MGFSDLHQQGKCAHACETLDTSHMHAQYSTKGNPEPMTTIEYHSFFHTCFSVFAFMFDVWKIQCAHYLCAFKTVAIHYRPATDSKHYIGLCLQSVMLNKQMVFWYVFNVKTCFGLLICLVVSMDLTMKTKTATNH